MRGRQGLAVLLALLLFGADVASAQNYAPGSLDHIFRVEWEVSRDAKGPVVAGYVYNSYGQAAEKMRLLVERLDDSGRVTGTSAVYVAGGVPSGGRAYFQASVPESAKYRVQVLAYSWGGRGL